VRPANDTVTAISVRRANCSQSCRASDVPPRTSTRMTVVNPLTGEATAARRWLSIVGVGEDGIAGLSTSARQLVSDAEFVFGGRRHLALVGSLVRGVARPWPSPFDGAVDEVLAQRHRKVCVLASGDPFHHGVGAVLARHVDMDEIVAVPAPSAFSLAAARLGWSIPETSLLSLHARGIDLLRPHLQPRSRLLALTSDGESPARIAELLALTGFGPSRLIVLEALGGDRERIRTTTAQKFDLEDIDPLNTVAIELEAQPDARIIPRTCGLSDGLFEHDGQITKREIRAITLSSLSPRRGELLWDIGAGSGSVAIEWMLADSSLRAIAIEARADRAARIRRNAAELGVPHLDVREGVAPEALRGLALPDAIFIGGGASKNGVLDAAIALLRSGGRLVVNAVTMQTESFLIARQGVLGGELTRIAIERPHALGSAAAWHSSLPITQWSWVKP
jgi:precorrin-6B C5,15-methyltransferase / cobalt-precorrin-6B C5,C15-methyltransferase